MKDVVTIEDIARDAKVSTATVSRYMNTPNKVAVQTKKRIQESIERLGYQPGKKVTKGPTIDEVARRARVSKATVSRVLNKSNLVGWQTKRRVLQEMKKLNFQPNMIARQLRKQETKLLGVVLPDISNKFYAKVLKGIEEVVYCLEYDVVLLNTNYSDQRELRHLQTLCERRADGFCFMCHHLNEEKIIQLKNFGLPYVVISRTLFNHPEIPFVNIDNLRGGYDATQYLISLGHTRIAIIAGPKDDQCSSLERILGYQLALKKADIQFNQEYLKEGDFTYARAEIVVKELLTLDNPPTAIFAISDQTAIGAIKGALSLGYSVPKDLSIMGFDNLDIARFYNPSISTIAQPMVEMGHQAAKILIDIIEKRNPEQIQVILPHSLIIRQSTAMRENQNERR